MQSESQMNIIMKYNDRSFNYRTASEFFINLDKQTNPFANLSNSFL